MTPYPALDQLAAILNAACIATLAVEAASLFWEDPS